MLLEEKHTHTPLNATFNFSLGMEKKHFLGQKKKEEACERQKRVFRELSSVITGCRMNAAV